MDDVEKVKLKIDIVDLISEHVTLKKAGRNFKGLCPFHNEKSPSFMVSPERQIWHCFGCSKGGDVFSFLMEYDKIEFSESLKILADKAGVKLTRSVFRNEQDKKRDLIFELNRLAAQFYGYLLHDHPSGKKALQYLTEKRGLSEALIKKFEIGYAPHSSHALLDFLNKKKKYAIQDILEAGLITQSGRDSYDFFRHRVVFPITNVQGNIVAFSGRALEEEQMPKYINTRETAVYKKGDSLYGLYFAKEGMRKEKKVLIVEGEFDVISSFKEGITNAVAVKGTALTESQIRLLKRYADKFLFCFDTDMAGNSAQRRSIEMIEKEGISASIITPPEGKDPDELLRENPAAFKKALKNEVNIYDFIIDSSIGGLDIEKAETKRMILAKTLPILSAIENEVIKEHYLRKLAEVLDSSLEAIIRQTNKIQRAPQQTNEVRKAVSASREEKIEQYLISLISQAKEPHTALRSAQEIIADVPFTTQVLDKIYKALLNNLNDEKLDIDAAGKSFPPELTKAFDRCCLTPIPEFEDEIAFLKEIEKTSQHVRSLSIRHHLKEIGEQIKTLEKEGDDEEIEKLRYEFGKYTRMLASPS